MTENWKSIVGYEGTYEISDQGNVRRAVTGSVTCGYSHVSLCKNGAKKNHRIHRLVAETFIGVPENMTVNHKNGIKSDNRLENLEVLSIKDNIQHAITVLGKRNYYGPKPRKFSKTEARDIRIRANGGRSYNSLAKEYGASQWAISRLVRRINYKDS